MTMATLQDPTARPAKQSASSTTKKGGLSRTLLNFWIDALLMVSFLALLFVASVVRFVFPVGHQTEGWTLWGLGYASWCDLQFGLLAFLTLGIVIHVMLHWPWVCGVVASNFLAKVDGKRPVIPDGIRTIYGVGLLIVILHLVGGAIALAALMIQAPPLQ